MLVSPYSDLFHEVQALAASLQQAHSDSHKDDDDAGSGYETDDDSQQGDPPSPAEEDRGESDLESNMSCNVNVPDSEGAANTQSEAGSNLSHAGKRTRGVMEPGKTDYSKFDSKLK